MTQTSTTKYATGYLMSTTEALGKMCRVPFESAAWYALRAVVRANKRGTFGDIEEATALVFKLAPEFREGRN